ncbi:beta-lactamase [Corynebacterium phocae]|uniref:Beta-lactamase n=1 Tax=Corynebacterium phocae TaxID=161895 RepID=A0A1L7D0S2_9CORY|nr:MBL fold metallo-hydrolase [Corynebacterium phocae]APT91749.1 beta-lactamase [Corynebacterium phocae]KAA8728513.1 MBL fold metallo-hydrolase [Corynebacterium phocae]
MEHPAYSQLRPVTQSAGVVLCDNPSYTALEGTNTWIIRAPEDDRAIVVDPGPEDEGHLNIVTAKAGEVALILLTHRHDDHGSGAQRLRQLTGAPIRAFDPRYCNGGEPLQDGEIISVEDITPRLEVVYTPGHTADSTCFFLWSGDPKGSKLEGILSGDTIAGRHTVMLSETDGDLGDYLVALDKLETLGRNVPLLPGHGPDLDDTSQVARKYIDRRHHRLNQIKEIRSRLGDDVDLKVLVDEMYDDVDPVLRHAAEQSTRTALKYLDEQ